MNVKYYQFILTLFFLINLPNYDYFPFCEVIISFKGTFKNNYLSLIVDEA